MSTRWLPTLKKQKQMQPGTKLPYLRLFGAHVFALIRVGGGGGIIPRLEGLPVDNRSVHLCPKTSSSVLLMVSTPLILAW